MRFLFITIFIYYFNSNYICKKDKKNTTLEHFFEDSETALEEMDGVMRDPTMTFSTNTMKGPDDKPLNEGKTVKGYKSAMDMYLRQTKFQKHFP